MSSLVAVEPPFGESGYGFDIKEEEEALLVNGKANDLFRSHTNEKATGPQGFFISRIAKSIGLKFVIITMIIYGLDQGGVESLVGLPQVYFYKQRGLTPAETTRVMSFAGISWSIKPLFALIMDAFPIMSWHFRPYMVSRLFFTHEMSILKTAKNIFVGIYHRLAIERLIVFIVEFATFCTDLLWNIGYHWLLPYFIGWRCWHSEHFFLRRHVLFGNECSCVE